MSKHTPEFNKKLIKKYERKLQKLILETEDIVKGKYHPEVKHTPEWYLKKIESNKFKMYDLVEEINRLEYENCMNKYTENKEKN